MSPTARRLVGIVPARGGSVRLPGKNVRPLGGRPLIDWTVAAAMNAGVCDRLVVSTDCADIAAIAKRCGAEVPFLRPAEFATAESTAAGYLDHLCSWLDEETDPATDLMILQPTSPLRTSTDIAAAWDLYCSTEVTSLVAVTPTRHDPRWALRLSADLAIRSVTGDNLRTLPPGSPDQACYAINGAIYIVNRQEYQATRSLYHPDTRAYVMPNERSLDIDTEFDWCLTELLVRSQGIT